MRSTRAEPAASVAPGTGPSSGQSKRRRGREIGGDFWEPSTLSLARSPRLVSSRSLPRRCAFPAFRPGEHLLFLIHFPSLPVFLK